MNKEQAELAIIQEQIVQIIGYDDDLDAFKQQNTTRRRDNRLRLLKMLLRARKASLEYDISKGKQRHSELNDIENKITFFGEWE